MIHTENHCAGFAYEYDEYGNTSRIEYLGLDGEPMIRSDLGYASYRDFYENGKWVETRYYDTKGELTTRTDKGYAIIKNTYDAFGQMILQEYFGIDPATKEEVRVIHTENHCAGFAYEYDEYGNKKQIKYLGLDGEPMIRSDL